MTDADDIDEPSGLSPTKIARAALDRDLHDARSRLDAEEQWHRIAEPMTLVADDSPLSAAHGQPRWSRWSRQHPDGGTWSAEDLEHYTVVLIGVDGATVGEGNRQYNLFRCRLEPMIDIAAVLDDPSVRQAFAQFASSRGDPAARDAAIGAVRACRTRGRSDWAHHEQRVDPLPCTPDTTIEVFGGTVLITDCRGVQVGNHLRQYNTVTAVLAPTVTAEDLLRDNLGLVGMIVDYACAGGTVRYRTVQDELAAAVCGEAEKAVPGPPSGRVVAAPAHVAFQDGIMVGEYARQTDAREFAARLPSAVREALDRAEAAAEEVTRTEPVPDWRSVYTLDGPSTTAEPSAPGDTWFGVGFGSSHDEPELDRDRSESSRDEL